MITRAFLSFLLIGLLAACGDTDNTTTDTDTAADLDTAVADDVVIDDIVTDETVDDLLTDDVVPDDAAGLVITRPAVLETTLGAITIGLYGEEMPVTSANFESYIEEDFFAGLIFHRVIPGFVAQGGGYDQTLTEKTPHDPIDFERTTVAKHVKYAVSMARTSNIDSATSQFFIAFDILPHLDYTSDDDFFSTSKFPCAVFGIVTDGFEVVDAMEAVETGAQGGMEDVPVTPIVITGTHFAD